MNIETSKITKINENKKENFAQIQNENSEISFANELKNSDKKAETEINTVKNLEIESDLETKDCSDETNFAKDKNDSVDNALSVLNTIVKELNQSDDKQNILIKPNGNNADTNKKGEILINNDMNINENKEILPQMNPNMNFSGNGEFSSLMQNSTKNQDQNILNSSASDLAEEAKILSTMAENVTIANQRQIKIEKPETIEKTINTKVNIFDQQNIEKNIKTVTKNNTVKKIDTTTNITVENIVKYDSIIMNKADVEVFTQIVENKEINLKNLTETQVEKSIKVSKTLADMLVKSMENNKPLRIDFDNNISVIIKISRDGKISADFLPSSQIAEAYLKENLPLLRQRFDENNIKYDELNQRERREHKENSKKKGRDNE